jgi:23S rRNA (adenine2503-C2)-methyltransferase
MIMVKTGICGLTADDIFDLIRPSGFSYADSVSVSNSIYKKSATGFSGMRISSGLKGMLGEIADSGIYPPVSCEISSDRSVKYLFRTKTGKEFETVYLPDNKRHTICVSTQSGCRMGCSFCETAKIGFRGSLTAGEIVNQIVSIPEAGKITHVVFMGMGEPMDNLENVFKACTIITAEWGLSISTRNVTVSTVGITPAIEQFLRISDCNLVLSLFSPFSAERREYVPAEKIYPVSQIIDIMKRHPLRKKRRLSLAYVMIKDLNDTDRHLEEIKSLLRSSLLRINLIPYHTIPDDLYSPSTSERMQYYKHSLVTSGISAPIRKSRGTDISAACGLLAKKHSINCDGTYCSLMSWKKYSSMKPSSV